MFAQLQARMANPAIALPGAVDALKAVAAIAERAGIPAGLVELVHPRASQINGCSVCVDMHRRAARRAGETEQRTWAVSAWRDAPYFTDAERAALALTEAVTRLADSTDPVPDDTWNDAATHYDEPQLAGLLLMIALVNMWNRLNVSTRQVAGASW